jgi:hypothetical protein
MEDGKPEYSIDQCYAMLSITGWELVDLSEDSKTWNPWWWGPVKAKDSNGASYPLFYNKQLFSLQSCGIELSSRA